ncbi:neprosin family prolyl endopeptidase [Actinoplanes oblitus]|uniref:Neprosin family prolyl endopeptidase n=1 Tax=Actinoplanes oblitus TaxID=3040509 RepID=A0ABY8WRC5_9ACTN|nr:neprosin family prolyl endopeptidase [Actinoplanes oblitus]WIN00405.1 neprosin family prolyl endopeptidase [Actinoplanes oblitus]
MDVGIIEQNPQAAPAKEGARARPRLAGPEADVAVEVAAQQLDEIRQHHLDIYARRDVVAQTVTAEGDRVDWVPVESQTSDAPAEPPHLDDTGPGAAERPTLAAARALAAPETDRGPAGTVPLLRKDVSELRPVGTLEDYLAKGPYRRQFTPPDDPHPPAVGAKHKYAHAYQFVTNYGTEGTVNTWKPYVQWSNEFSLGQLWIVRGSGGALQTLEVGVQTYKDLYGDWSPHLFIFYTTNGYSQSGDNLGGYNTDVKGWVQTGTSTFPGMRMSESVVGGNQYDTLVKVQLWQGNWWVRVGAEWMGYYPASLYSPTGLRSMADQVDWGGEIVDDSDNHPEPTSTAMGSGEFSRFGWQHAAYMRNLSYQSDANGTLARLRGTTQTTNPASYDITADFSGSTGWGSYMYWGGPGGV